MTQKRTDHDQRRHSRRSILRTCAATVAATIGVSTTATSQSDTDALSGGIIGYGLSPESMDWRAVLSGMSSQYSRFGVPKAAESLADDMRNEFAANQDAWVSYGNWMLDEADVSALESAEIAVDVSITRTRWPTRSETVPTVVRTEYDSTADEWTSIEWLTEEADDPDYRVELRNTAAENAQDELQKFRRNFIDEEGGDHELPSDAYVSELAGKYAMNVGFGSETKSVLELLVGDLDGI